jgi:hypothetical protein
MDSTPHLDAQNPWPGLAAYTEVSRGFFHGRSQEAEELECLVRRAPLVVLYGGSGLGKSSLLQAGLFQRLRSADMLPVYVRIDFSRVHNEFFDHDPKDANKDEISQIAVKRALEQIARRLEEEIAAQNLEAPPHTAGESLWRWLHRNDFELWSTDNRLFKPVLVLDQFEELFSHWGGKAEWVTAMFDALADLAENRITAEVASDRSHGETLDTLTQRYHMLLSFREDCLPELRAWERKLPSLLRHDLRLLPMTLDHAELAVQEAGKAVLASGVARPIVDFVAALGNDARNSVPTVEPVLLSLTCTQLNRRREGKPIDLELLAAAGQDILEGFYRDALADLPDGVHRFIEDYLLQGERTRGSYAVEEAVTQRFISAEQVDLLTRERRLLRIVETQGNVARIELIHDRLVDVVRAAKRDRAERAADDARLRSELEAAEAVRIADGVAALQRLTAEKAARVSIETWRARWLMAILVGLFVVVGFAVSLAIKSHRVEQKLASEAERATEAASAAMEAKARADKQSEISSTRLAQVTLLARYGWVADSTSGLDEALVSEGLRANEAVKGQLNSVTAQDLDRRMNTTIEIWAKDVDQNKVNRALSELGFQITERPAKVTHLASNALWFGRATGIAEVKLVALALMRAGVQLRAIRPISNEIVSKRDLAFIQIGADTSVVNRAAYTVDRLVAKDAFGPDD